MSSNYVKNFSMGTFVFSDGTTPTPLAHTADTDLGTMSISGVVPGLREASDYERKGAYCSSAYTTRRYPEMSLSFHMTAWTDASAGTISDFLLGTSGTPFATRVSTLAPSGAAAGKVPFGFSLAATIEGSDFGDASDHSGTLTKCRLTDFSPLQEGDPNEMSISATVLGAITGDFAASEA